MQRWLAAAALTLGGLLGTTVAHAQTPFERNIDIQSFRPAPGPGNFLTVMGARVEGHVAFSVSGWANYSYRPFTIYNAVCEDPNADPPVNCRPDTVRSVPVEHMLTFNIMPTITLFRRLQIGIDLPVTWVQGQSINPVDATPTNPPMNVDRGAIADPRIDLKVRIYGNGLTGPAFAANAFIQIPTGRFISSDAFVGDSSVVFGARLIGDFRINRVAIAANVGYLGRPQVGQILSSYVGHRLTWGAAVSVDITPRLAALVEGYGSTDLVRPQFLQQSAAELDLAMRFKIRDITITGGAGPGLIRGVGVPVARGFIGVTWAPYKVDTDRDGVMDDVDRCINDPEDRDGFEDADGCPERDNDSDGNPDLTDRCPNEAEDIDQFQDQDGCPDRDNDNDNVPDDYDGCPMVPEDRDGDRDEDGCPDDDRDRDGIKDDVDRCPREAEDTDGYQDEDGCPDPDNDGDGVPDTADQCSTEPETVNGLNDEDGCPDTIPDDDHDGIPNNQDQCPTQPETYNGITDTDGCPERGRSLVRIDNGVIQILQQVNFARDSDRIVGRPSFQILDAVAAVLAAHPEITRVDVEGHTDNTGDAAHNRDLSQRRAAAVQAYIVTRGVDAARLTSHGFGPDRPLEANTSARNRARNRRVEFHIVGVAVPTPATPPANPTPDPNAQSGGGSMTFGPNGT